MTEQENPAAGSDGAAAPAPRAGDLLRAARERAGLTIDAVAQQLKLAPRQVRAIEEEDFARLPGRTFVRGFVRNYARLLRLDADPILAALSVAAPTLETPALQPPSAAMGELPSTESAGLGWTRWAIPATLIAIVAALAVYEFLRPAPEARHEVRVETPPAAKASGSAAAPTEGSVTPLANPVANNASASAEQPNKAPAATSAEPSAAASALPAESAAPASAAASPAAPTVMVLTTAPPGSAALTLAFRDYSWTEVRDRNGTVLLSRMNPGGTTQSIIGAAPLDVIVGNASDVTLTFNGSRVDLAPYMRQNVARLKLQ